MEAFEVFTWNTHVRHLLAIPHQYLAVRCPSWGSSFEKVPGAPCYQTAPGPALSVVLSFT